MEMTLRPAVKLGHYRARRELVVYTIRIMLSCQHNGIALQHIRRVHGLSHCTANTLDQHSA